MNNHLYGMYVASRSMVDHLEASLDIFGEAELTLLSDMKLSHVIIDETKPEYAARYKMEQTMFASFTPEQRDFICSQIGHLYLLWKDRMWIEDNPNQHWLGIGKEDLKTMICGE